MPLRRPGLPSPSRPICLAALALGIAACDAASSSTASTPVTCAEPACAETAKLNEQCSNNAQIQLGKYRILNNLWGVNRTGIAGQQCIWETCNTGDGIAWGTNYDWQNGPSGQVESFTAAILGWHFGPIDPASGLPIRVGDQKNVTCTWNYRMTNEGAPSINVAYDLWLAPTSTPGNSNPSDEIMIWLHKAGGAAPIGVNVANGIEIAGAQWSLSEGKPGSFNVYSFVRVEDTPCAELDFNDFFQYLVKHRGFDENKYLIGIEAGTEVFAAKGELQTHYYGCDIQ